MKRDMDLVRQLLFVMEKAEHGHCDEPLVVDGYTAEQIGYHAYLLNQAGLIVAVDATAMDSEGPVFIPVCLTWAGHDFLDSVKDDTVWQKAKTYVLKPAAGVAFDVLISWLKAEALKKFGLQND